MKVFKKGLRILFLLGIVLVAVVAAWVFHQTLMREVERAVVLNVHFGTLEEEEAFRERMLAHRERMRKLAENPPYAPLDDPVPFQEVEVLDEDSRCGSDGFGGLLVFDANGDGRRDIYLTHTGGNWFRPTDEDGVLQDEPWYQHNVLYINVGNEADGTPRYRQAQDIAAESPSHSREELLIENLLHPRTSPREDDQRLARLSIMAAAADLDSDGRLDLLVGNGHPGFLFSHPKTQRLIPRFVQPTGRQEHRVRPLVEGWPLHFLYAYEARNNINDTWVTYRGREPIGANSIFRNLGDSDGDGLPEWEDITEQTGLGGKRNTLSLVVFDVDLDGDLDVYEGNSGDPDLWPGGAEDLAGEANQLYINQLAETGKLTFEERSGPMKVSGLYDEENPPPVFYRFHKIPLLPLEYTLALQKLQPWTPGFLELPGGESEHAEYTWACVAQDVNGDGYQDLWVANDLTVMRLYLNEQGQRFREPESYVRRDTTGNWMGFSAADFDGDKREDLFCANLGGSSLNVTASQPRLEDLIDPTIGIATFSLQHFMGTHNTLHAMVDGRGYGIEMKPRVRHSTIMPPDTSLPNNLRSFSNQTRHIQFDIDSLDPYEFAWGTTSLDVQNDGRPDLYWVGGMLGRGGGLLPVMGSSPGRLLVNATPAPGDPWFVDLTAEYHLFNILELKYDKLESEGYIYRKSPSQNWGRRSIVTSQDLSVWGLVGPGLLDRVSNHDLIQCSENGRAVMAADLNGDGFKDVIIRNMGGYDSRRSNATNLKARVGGKIVVLPSHDPNLPAPTNFDPGTTRIFINQHSRGAQAAGWLAVDLRDDRVGRYNRDALGARVEVNGRWVQTRRVGQTFLSNQYGPLIFGLADDTARTVTVQWPDRERTTTTYHLGGLRNRRITLYHSGSWR